MRWWKFGKYEIVIFMDVNLTSAFETQNQPGCHLVFPHAWWYIIWKIYTFANWKNMNFFFRDPNWTLKAWLKTWSLISLKKSSNSKEYFLGDFESNPFDNSQYCWMSMKNLLYNRRFIYISWRIIKKWRHLGRLLDN